MVDRTQRGPVEQVHGESVNQDGKTAYGRLKGKRCRREVVEFGQRVMLRVSGQVLGGLMQHRWVDGIWLGVRFHTREHIGMRLSDGCVVRTPAIKEMPPPTVKYISRF